MATTRKTVPRPLQTRRYKDLKLLYSKDDGTDIPIRIRTRIGSDSALGSPRYLTPVTPLLLARQTTMVCPVTTAKNVRHAVACYGIPGNVSGEGNYSVPIVYHPTDGNHQQQLREVINYVTTSTVASPQNVLSVTYYGEGFPVE